jgi:hypothetical protein
MKITTVVATNQIMLEASLYHSTTIHHKVTLPFAAITNFKSIHELLTHHVSQGLLNRSLAAFVRNRWAQCRQGTSDSIWKLTA